MMKTQITALMIAALLAGCSPTPAEKVDAPAPAKEVAETKTADVAKVSAETPVADPVLETTPAAEAKPAAPVTDVKDASGDKTKPQELAWDDLMPEGEFERLEALYENFYAELEARMAQQSTLMDAAKQGEFDVAAAVAEGSANDSMEQIGTYNTVSDLNGAFVRIPGYIVPLDFNAGSEHKEFLLVPYFGACLHTPPPPPNQILYVKSDPPAKIPDIYEPVWLEGTLTTGEFINEMGNSAYEMALKNLEPYDY